ncbi:MAG TPA: DUF4760 domain-containing protein [Allosphingosinicella sp.]|nr:DUF4760 domain-containing protein [Allosphingosinicella sp.]
MPEMLYAWILAEHDFLEALAALATVFALFVPLPIFVFSTLMNRHAERRERAFALLEKIDSGEARALRDRVLKIIGRYDFSSDKLEDALVDEDRGDLRQFMNAQELIGAHLNTSRIDRETFFRLWRTAYVRDWDRLRPYVDLLRERLGPHLYVEWERAAARAEHSLTVRRA